MTDQLYEQDYALWLDRTVEALKNRELGAIDWQNLIEEVEGLAGRDRRELQSRLTNLLEHLLKRSYIKLSNCYRGWINTITREQQEITSILCQSPSLKQHYLDTFTHCWINALKRVEKEYNQFELPKDCPFPQDPDRLLNDIFWE